MYVDEPLRLLEGSHGPLHAARRVGSSGFHELLTALAWEVLSFGRLFSPVSVGALAG